MSKIREDIIQHVIDTARIEDVVGDFVTLRKAGVNLTGLCPFHDDSHDGNFIVRPSTISPSQHGNTYRCFACESKGDAVTFLMEAENMTFPDAIRYLGRKYGIDVDDVPISWTPPPPRPKPAPLPMLTLSTEYVKHYRQGVENDPLVRWIYSLPWDDAQRERIPLVLQLYGVGTRNGWTAFWQIDEQRRVRTGKLMHYKDDGHRDKATNPNWFHALLKKSGHFDESKLQMIPTYFGMHLLSVSDAKNATIHIVESEKTALLMAIAYGYQKDNLWLACCGKWNLTKERMEPLINSKRHIVCYPDKDGVKDWKKRVEAIGYRNITVDTRFMDYYWKPCDGDKADIADLLVRWLHEHEAARQADNPRPTAKPTVLDQMAAKNPALAEMIDTFDLIEVKR